MQKSILVLVFLTLAAAALPAAADMLLGVSGHKGNSPGDLFQVNPATGELTLIQDVPDVAGLSGLAADSGGHLYATTASGPFIPSTLIELDRGTGDVLRVVGVVTPEGKTGITIGDLAFQPGTDLLFGIRSNADGGGAGGEIYVIDTESASATLIGQSEPVGIGGGLAFSADSTLWRTGGSGPLFDVYELVQLDPSDASTDTVAVTGMSRFYDGLAADPVTGLLYATDDTGIAILDPSAGTETSLSPGPGVPLSDVAFVPDVAPVTATTWGRLKRMYGGD